MISYTYEQNEISKERNEVVRRLRAGPYRGMRVSVVGVHFDKIAIGREKAVSYKEFLDIA